MKTELILTIDTETPEAGHMPQNSFDRFVLGTTEEGEYGARWIGAEVAKLGVSADFFLDAYGSANSPPGAHQELCRTLLRDGHAIQLHTHPRSMYDPNRCNMHEYSLEEQANIIERGVMLIRSWTGDAPQAHRAGNYGANLETLAALRKHRIPIDSSYIPGRENCRLPLRCSNLPCTEHGVWEIPITSIREHRRALGIPLPFLFTYRKLDVNLMSANLLRKSILRLWGHIPYIILFAHSFSFVIQLGDGERFIPNRTVIDIFSSTLQFLRNEDIPVVTFRDIAVRSAAEF